MAIPVKVKLLTPNAKMPEAANEGDLYDLFADSFDNSIIEKSEDRTKVIISQDSCDLSSGAWVLVKTGIALELPKQYDKIWSFDNEFKTFERYFKKFGLEDANLVNNLITAYAVADLRPRSGLALKHGITILNSPATIDNSYRKEIGVILKNTGSKEFLVKKGDKIAQMLIRPLYPSKLIQVEDFEDTGRGGYGSTGK